MSDRKVWAISTGSYSDYRIIALFDTKALAKQYERSMRDGYDAEVFPMTVFGENDFVTRTERGPLWKVTMRHNGEKAYAQELSMVDEASGHFITSSNVKKSTIDATYIFHDIECGYCSGWQYKQAKARGWKCEPSNFWLQTTCHAKTEEHAIKIANERRIGVIQHPNWWMTHVYEGTR